MRYRWALGAAALAGLGLLGSGLALESALWSGVGAGGLLTAASGGWWLRKHSSKPPKADAEESQPETEAPRRLRGSHPTDTEDLVEQMLEQGRYVLLLRSQIAANLSQEQLRRAVAALDGHTALVPAGQLCIGLAGKETDQTEWEANDQVGCGTVVEVPSFRIDRYPVTNAEFQQFVEHGGYTQSALWDPQVWPAVVEFIDHTGCPGPRFWKHGRHPSGTGRQPVVGISWFEASAYARWAGKRLPTDPEWEKSGSWPIQLSDSTLLQRRYPWGDLMERERANLWGSGPGHVVPVDEFSTGESAGGVQQLIGNVWEWTHGDYGAGEYRRLGVSATTPMKSIRGAAFDTYFDVQATCQFPSGENPMARKHNIGFRCAVSTRDLVSLARSDEALYQDEADDEDHVEPVAEEVGA